MMIQRGTTLLPQGAGSSSIEAHRVDEVHFTSSFWPEGKHIVYVERQEQVVFSATTIRQVMGPVNNAPINECLIYI